MGTRHVVQGHQILTFVECLRYFATYATSILREAMDAPCPALEPLNASRTFAIYSTKEA